jgi:hypothetical protein
MTFLKRERLLDEESQIAEPEPLLKIVPEPLKPSAIPEPELLLREEEEEEETPLSDFMFEIEDELFADFGNT